MSETFNRRYSRKKFDVELFVDSIYKQDYEKLPGVDAKIELFDISKGGVGFYSSKDMPLGYYFNAEIVFDKENHFKTVLKIVRKEAQDEKFIYGSEFVGLAQNLADMIEEVL